MNICYSSSTRKHLKTLDMSCTQINVIYIPSLIWISTLKLIYTQRNRLLTLVKSGGRIYHFPIALERNGILFYWIYKSCYISQVSKFNLYVCIMRLSNKDNQLEIHLIQLTSWYTILKISAYRICSSTFKRSYAIYDY